MILSNLELNPDLVMVNNPFAIVILGDSNAKSSLWYNNSKLSSVHTKKSCRSLSSVEVLT